MCIRSDVFLSTYVEVKEYALTARLGNLKNSVLLGCIVRTEANIKAHHIGIKRARRTESGMFFATL